MQSYTGEGNHAPHSTTLKWSKAQQECGTPYDYLFIAHNTLTTFHLPLILASCA